MPGATSRVSCRLDTAPSRSHALAARMQGEARALRHIRLRRLRLRRQRLQREDLLSLTPPGCDPVPDRVTDQRIDRRFLARVKGQIRVLDVSCNQPGPLKRMPDPLGDRLHQNLKLFRRRLSHRHEPRTALTGSRAIHTGPTEGPSEIGAEICM